MHYQYLNNEHPSPAAEVVQRPLTAKPHSRPGSSHDRVPSRGSVRSSKSTSLREYTEARPRSGVSSRGGNRPSSSRGNKVLANIDYDDDEAIESTWFGEDS